MLPTPSVAGDPSNTVAGKLFDTRGPATAKLLSPSVVRVRGTASVLRKMSGDENDQKGKNSSYSSVGFRS